MSSKITHHVPFNLNDPHEKEGFLHKRGTMLTQPSIPLISLRRSSFFLFASCHMIAHPSGVGVLGKGYQQRWFILHDSTLYYFKGKPKGGKAEYAGSIPLLEATVSETEEPGKSFSFSITVNKEDGTARQYWLRGDTQLTKKEWMGVLLKKAKGVASLAKEDRKFVMTHDDVIAGLTRMYQENLEEIEKRFQWDEFFGPTLKRSDFEALPQVLMLGQFSVGKTSFIRYLLGRDFPGMRIGPEPTTDRFVAIMHADEDRVIPGNALSVDPDKPFQAVNKFGSGFLSKFEASCLSSDILRKVTLVDTPGVLAGDKQRIGRDYDFSAVVRQFADTAHLILLLFDPHKLDISVRIPFVPPTFMLTMRTNFAMLSSHCRKTRRRFG